MTRTSNTGRTRTRRWRGAAIRLAAAGFTAAAGLAITASPAAAESKPAQEYLVRLNGCSTTGAKMAMHLATAYAKQLRLPGVRVDAGADPDEYDVVAEGAEGAQRMRVQVRAKGTGYGLEPLLKGQADFWMACRQIKESDLEGMRKKGIPNVPTLSQMVAPGNENVIALSAMAFVVNQKNPVPSLSFAQIRDIFSGRVTSWAQVGGPSNTPLGVYAPEATLATADFFCSAVMGNPDTQKCLNAFPRLAAPRIQLMEDISDAVASNPAGISFVDFSARRGTRALPLGSDCGGAVEPSVYRIKTDEYPLTRKHIFYAMPGRTLPPAARDFLQMALGPPGQTAAQASGLADLLPGVAEANYTDERLDTVRDAMDGGRTHVRAPDVQTFERSIQGSERSTITFRFQAGTNALDSRAENDLARLIALVQQPGYAGAGITLVGFSSTTGDYEENRALSRERADAVRERLAAAGIQNITAVGVGPAAAVACNLDPSTSVMNQRVEVWLRKPRGS